MAESTTITFGTPWSGLDMNQWDEWVPELLPAYQKKSVFFQMVDYQVDLGALRTGKVHFTQRLDPEPNISVVDNRAIWLPQLYVDSRSIDVTASRYGGKVQLHEYDDMITRWRQNGSAGLRTIITDVLAQNMIQTLDRLARNAFLSSFFVNFSGGVSGFTALTTAQTFEEGIARQQQMAAEYAGLNNPIFCLTAPAATYTLKSQSSSGEWVDRSKYAQPGALVNYEIGSYEGVRFATHPDLTLWNCGVVTKQAMITASVTAGDGSPDPESTDVDGAWRVGQAGATHGVSYTDGTGTLAVGDYVTLHRERSSAGVMGVANGVKWDSVYNIERRIVAVSGGKVYFDKPVMSDDFSTEVTTGIYGYMTVGRPVHAALFIKGPQSVVAGVIRPPRTHTPPAIDDTESIFRFSWDAYLGYAPFYTDRFSVYFYTGPVAIPGTTTIVTI